MIVFIIAYIVLGVFAVVRLVQLVPPKGIDWAMVVISFFIWPPVVVAFLWLEDREWD